MTVEFALFLSPDGIALAHRQPAGHWALIGDTPVDVPDLGAQLRRLRQLGEARAGGYFPTLLILPNDQILYDALAVDDGPGAEMSAMVGRALAGRTPYQLSELAFDFRSLEPGTVQVAAVAQHTLREAMDFARQAGFNGVGFAASPPFAKFGAVPIFEMAAGFSAPTGLGEGLAIGPDQWPGAEAGPAADAGAEDATELSAQAGQVFVAEIAPAPAAMAEAGPAPEQRQDDSAAEEAPSEPPVEPSATASEREDGGGLDDLDYEDIDDIEAQLADMAEAAPEDGEDDRPTEEGSSDDPAAQETTAEDEGRLATDDTPSFALTAEADAPDDVAREEPADVTPDEPVAAARGDAVEDPAHFAIEPQPGEDGDAGDPDAGAGDEATPNDLEPPHDTLAEPAPAEDPGALAAAPMQFGTARRRQEPGGPAAPAPGGLVRRPARIAIAPAGDPASGIAITPHGGPLRRSPRLSLDPEMPGSDAAEPAPPGDEATGAPRAEPVLSRHKSTTREDGDDKAPQDAFGAETSATEAPDDVPSLPAGLAARASLPPKLAATLQRWRSKSREQSASSDGAAYGVSDDLKVALASDPPLADPLPEAPPETPPETLPRGRILRGRDRDAGPSDLAAFQGAEFGSQDGLITDSMLARRSDTAEMPSLRTALVLSLVFILLLALVAVWSALFLPDSRVAQWLGRVAPDVDTAAAPPPARQDGTISAPEGIALNAELPDRTSDIDAGAQALAEGRFGNGMGAGISGGDIEAEALADGALTESDLALLAPVPQPEAAALPGDPGTPLVSDEAAAQPQRAVAPPNLPSLAETEEIYAAFGIWQLPPPVFAPPPEVFVDATAQEDVYVASIDPVISSYDAVALRAPSTAPDPVRAYRSPPPFGTVFDLNAAGLVRPTPDGAVTPEGAVIFAGRPAIVATPRPEAAAEVAAAVLAPPSGGDAGIFGEAADAGIGTAILAAFPPQPRPGDLAERRERQVLGGLTRTELGERRPAPRPSSVQDRAQAAAEAAALGATELAIAVSPRPPVRPRALAQEAAARGPAAAASTASPAPPPANEVSATVTPDIPSSATVSRTATIEGAINLREVNLIGITGTASERRALVRLPSGRFRTVSVGDRLDGGRIAAIGATSLQYVKNGRNITLEVPSG